MGEFESRIKYAKSVGADVSRPQLDRRTTSQRVTDEMNQMKAEIKWYRKWLEQIDIDGPVTGEDAEDMRRWARLALTQTPNQSLDLTQKAAASQLNRNLAPVSG